jgi:RecB family exonuclease
MQGAQELFPLDDYTVPRLDFSELSVFLQCKFRYKAKYIDRRLKQDQRPTPYLNAGRAVHAALADLYRSSQIHSRDVDVPLLMRSKWPAAGFASSREDAAWFERCVDMVRRFVDRNPFEGTTLLVESSFADQFEGRLVTSRLDRVDKVGADTCEIIDYKIGAEEVELEKYQESLQWLFHLLASRRKLHEDHGLRVAAINFYFLQAGKTERIEPTTERVGEAIQHLRSVLQRMSNEHEFGPTLNPFCADCRFDRICPAMQERRRSAHEEGELPEEDD